MVEKFISFPEGKLMNTTPFFYDSEISKALTFKN